MRLHGVEADHQQLGDFPVHFACGDQLEDFPLARGQRIAGAGAAFLPLQIVADQFFRHGRKEIHATLGHRANRAQQFIGARALEHIARRTRGQDAEEIILVLVHGQDQNLDERVGFLQRTRRFETVHARHANIHQGEIRLKRMREAQRLYAVGCLANDFHVGLRVQDHTHAFAHNGVVIGEQYPDFRHRLVPSAAGCKSRSAFHRPVRYAPRHARRSGWRARASRPGPGRRAAWPGQSPRRHPLPAR